MKSVDAAIQREPPGDPRHNVWYAVLALAFVALMVLLVPPVRWFFAISIPIGALFAAGIYYWNQRRPVKLDERHNKRPLGLS